MFILHSSMSDVLTKPKIKIEEDLKKQILEQEQLEQQVIVHCNIRTPQQSPIGVRIWPTTFLLDHTSDHKSTLLHNENIPLMPDWKMVPPGVTFRFTLIFSSLPKTCNKFHLVELIPQSGGFEALNITRNDRDVYEVDF